MNPEYPELLTMVFTVLIPGIIVPAAMWTLLVCLAVRGMKNL